MVVAVAAAVVVAAAAAAAAALAVSMSVAMAVPLAVPEVVVGKITTNMFLRTVCFSLLFVDALWTIIFDGKTVMFQPFVFVFFGGEVGVGWWMGVGCRVSPCVSCVCVSCVCSVCVGGCARSCGLGHTCSLK